ncbi:ABC transporter ATP-binding protein [Actinomadura rudentiformis]|uniref:ABC transporter ATP-binding protein n=1 Tax=Actinomadura rudentiformis TaxID=359158 RepID=A0A6H9YHL8_9ACTN|nr:ABC transporter ATP-binding protein [Actinomadura rudentiformis]KAB2341813.1 ABC transporter ATP-binding protein [Actinomadura rudentiformis]
MIGITGVSVRFGGVHALTDVTFTVPEGETCGVIGPNGAGKTTLFDVVTGLRRPTAGSVHLNGADVTTTSAVKRSRLGLRRTFQRPQVFGRLTVLDNVLAAVEWHGGGGGLAADLVGWRTRRRLESERRAKALDVLDRCGIADLSTAYAADLPIGRRRMVELARAIVDDPDVLLLDEPTSGLDTDQAALFATVVRDLDATVLLVEHDVGFVMEACERVVVLDLGKVIADATPTQIREDPVVRAAYLG